MGGKRLGGKRPGGKRHGGQKVGGQKTGGQKTGGQKTRGQKSCHRSESKHSYFTLLSMAELSINMYQDHIEWYSCTCYYCTWEVFI